MKIFVLADPDTYLAFSLAGIRGRAVQSPSEVPAALEALVEKETGLVLMTERLAEANRALILEIPDTQGPVPERRKATERILSLLRT
jgi:vacuolar-type H+-ATPase subunit F/Vma7